MQTRFCLLFIALGAVVLAAGCQAGGSAGIDTTELQYVAAERARGAGRNAAVPQDRADLAGFVDDVAATDGRIRLSLESAVRRTLLSSLDIQVASYTPAIAETDILAAESAFDATMFIESSYLATDMPNTAFVALAGNQFREEDVRSVSAGLRKSFATGGSITVSENVEYFQTNSPLQTSPVYTTNFMLELSQPLLRNFGLPANKAQIYIASHARDASLHEFMAEVMDVLVQVEQTYWELVFAVRDVEVRQRSLTLADEVLRKERSREEQKMAKPLEVSRARAAVTNRRAELIRAQNLVRNLSDQLKNLMNDPALPLGDETMIVPADAPSVAGPRFDRAEAVARAIAARPELAALREQIRAVQARERFDENQLLPRLDMTFLWRLNSVSQGANDAFVDQITNRFADYGAGLVFEVPIGNRGAESQLRRTRLELQQARLSLENLTQDVVLEVNTAMREVETNLEEVEATREARIAARDTLDGEQARYDVGDVTNEELLRAQRDLEEAERNELLAITQLNISAIRLERAVGTLLDYNNIHVVAQDFVEP